MNLLRKHKSIGVIVCLLLIGAGARIYDVFARNLTSESAKNFEKEQAILTSIASRNIERHFYDIQKRLEVMALSPIVREVQRGEACNQNLQDLLEVNKKELNNLGRIGKDGRFVCAVNRTIVGEPASKYGTYFETISKDPEHKPVMSPLIFPTGAASAVIAVHVPVYDLKGQFNGTIGGAVYFDDLQKNLLADTQLSKNTIVSLYDNNLDILYDSDPLVKGKNLLAEDIASSYFSQQAARDFAKHIQTVNEDTVIIERRREAHQAVYKRVPVIGRSWTLSISVPQKDIQEATGGALLRALFAVVVLVAVGLSIWGVSKTMLTQPGNKRIKGKT